MASSLESLTAQADSIHQRYRRSFAGKLRATRDVKELDGLTAELNTLSAALPADAADIKRQVDDWLKLYKSEREAIVAVQAGGPDAVRAWKLVDRAEINFFRYVREFAGQSRTTRDLALLEEMADRQEKLLAELAPLAARVKNGQLIEAKDGVAGNLEMFRTELKQIPAARSTLAPAEYARVLATLANGQFGLYRRHFAGHARPSRRTELLRRILRSLQDIEKAMVAVRDLGVNSDVHRDNLGKVQDRIKHHTTELEQILAAKKNTSVANIVGMLGDEANKVFNAYRAEFASKPRATADLARLDDLLDQLHEIAATMESLDGGSSNMKNLTIVLEAAKTYEREHEAIKAAKKN